jgi:alpha-mannosidase
MALSRKGTRITAFCPNPGGSGTVLRLWEQAGDGGPITITLPKGFNASKAQPINLRGVMEGEAVKVKDGRFTADIGAWAPKSWVLE